MALKFVLLTTLRNRSMTGYELAKAYDKSASNFWRSSHQQIYRELKKMYDEGLLSCTEEQQLGKPDKKIYRVTQSGRLALADWLKKPATEKVINSPLLAKFMAGDMADVPSLVEDIQTLRKQHAFMLEEFNNTEQSLFPDKEALTDSERLVWFCLRRGIIFEQMWLQWSDEILPDLQRMAEHTK